MAFTGDPINSITDRVRLITGDTDEIDEGYPDEVYQYVLEKHGLDENKAAIEVLRMLVAKYANFVTEKAGGLFVKEAERYQHYKDLYDLLVTDPRTSLAKAGVGFTGGLSKQEKETSEKTQDLRHNPLRPKQPNRFRKYLPWDYYRSTQ